MSNTAPTTTSAVRKAGALPIIPFGVTATATIGDPRLLTGDRATILLPLSFADEFATESFAINYASPQGLEIALSEIRLALPEYLNASDDDVLADAAMGKLSGKAVRAYRTPQKNDPARYNVRLAPNLAQADKKSVLAFLKNAALPKAHAAAEGDGVWGEPSH